ncbi:FGGY-family carbohydrate kinase [Paenibacillus cremeus]|uniref:Carbohydrate kinase FGGY N-terminal domain-containing protein n=1 Tax=Paenibacillus cremeus TaxID=2163881 RepID=A0A559K8E8_9BACL|nr:FGGY family carbohydrate kinase [Paenibacillus cremeus]TVY08397.1 hypothetical protein FPZ49_19355 [Paenibacillus cremeus]
MFLGIDMGTTHCKAGLVTEDGRLAAVASRPTPVHSTSDGGCAYDPDVLWQTISEIVSEVYVVCGRPLIACVGVTSMAEAGLLVDRTTGIPSSEFVPWYDTRALSQTDKLIQESDLQERFAKTGLHASFKYGLAKLLWIQDHHSDALKDAVWLSAADYIVYRLTGTMVTDYTLAARTYCFDIASRSWDHDWIRHFGFSSTLFPEAVPSGVPIGHTSGDLLDGDFPPERR